MAQAVGRAVPEIHPFLIVDRTAVRYRFGAMQDDTFIVVFTLMMFAVVVASTAFHYSRAQTLFDRFLTQNGFRLLKKEHRTFFRGPYFFTPGKGSEVYYVTVEDRQRQVRRGYVRVGGGLLGMLSDNIDVIWDKPRRVFPVPPEPRGFPVIPLDQTHEEL